jgi:two-component system response regulator AtoC
VRESKFRDDLFYRLNVLPIKIPPLRERKEDIPLLVDHFIGKYNRELGKPIDEITQEALNCLLNYNWKGNVRELENIIERAIVLTESKQIQQENLPAEIQNPREESRISLLNDELSIKKASRYLEIDLIKKALLKTKGNHTHAAKLLEISHRALLYKIKDYGIETKNA